MIQIFLIISILAGELVKFPLFGIQGPILLDIWVFTVCIIGIFKIRFKLKKPNLIILSGLLFSLIATLSLILTHLHLSYGEYIISFSYTLRFLLYLYLGWVIHSNGYPEFRKQISKTLLISGVGFAILGLAQFIFFPNLGFLQSMGWDPHYFRTVSTFLDPNFAGAFFVLTLLLWYENRAEKWSALIFMTLFLVLLTTFSRSSYAMFLVSGLTLSFFKKSKALFASTLLLFLLLLLGFQVYSQLVARPRGINREQSASYRVDTWQDGVNVFQKSPLLGIGFNAYKYAIREYHLADSAFLDSRGSSTNDSSLLYVLSTTGLVGFLAYILFLFSLIKSGFKNNPVLTAAIIGLIIHSFFANSLFYPFILIWIMLSIA